MTKLTALIQRIDRASRRAGRARHKVSLLAVSKTFGADCVRALAAQGQRLFGESYVQEALSKQAALADLDLEWHFIGPIQSNKTSEIAEHFSWVHSVDRMKIARRLSTARSATLPPLNICVQVNISAEASKSGCAPAEALDLCREVATLPNLRLRGLMAIPALCKDPDLAARPYAALRSLADEIGANGVTLDTLSAGMSDDFEIAIAHGANIVRIGSALFGQGKRKTV